MSQAEDQANELEALASIYGDAYKAGDDGISFSLLLEPELDGGAKSNHVAGAWRATRRADGVSSVGRGAAVDGRRAHAGPAYDTHYSPCDPLHVPPPCSLASRVLPPHVPRRGRAARRAADD